MLSKLCCCFYPSKEGHKGKEEKPVEYSETKQDKNYYTFRENKLYKSLVSKYTSKLHKKCNYKETIYAQFSYFEAYEIKFEDVLKLLYQLSQNYLSRNNYQEKINITIDKLPPSYRKNSIIIDNKQAVFDLNNYITELYSDNQIANLEKYRGQENVNLESFYKDAGKDAIYGITFEEKDARNDLAHMLARFCYDHGITLEDINQENMLNFEHLEKLASENDVTENITPEKENTNRVGTDYGSINYGSTNCTEAETTDSDEEGYSSDSSIL